MTFQPQSNDPSIALPAPAGVDPSHAAFDRCLDRLEELISTETHMLRSGAHVDFDALNQRKTHALLEFTRVARALAPGAPPSRRRLAALRNALGANTEALDQHLRAMREITRLIVDTIRNDDSDGTYTMKGTARR